MSLVVTSLRQNYRVCIVSILNLQDAFLRPNCTGGVSFWHFMASCLHRAALTAKLGQAKTRS